MLKLLVSFIKRPHQSLAGIGIAAFVRLMSNAGVLFSDDKWLEVVLSLKEAASSTLPDFSFVDEDINLVWSNGDSTRWDNGEPGGSGLAEDDLDLRRHRLSSAVSDAKCRAAVQLLLVQVDTQFLC